MEKVAFIGCSRGLGQAVTLDMDKKGLLEEAFLVARTMSSLESLRENMKAKSHVFSCDLAQRENIFSLLEKLKQQQVERIFYFAGGGPHGLFNKKQWKDHLWSLQVSFLSPSELLHSIVSSDDFSFVKQIVFVGSLVADSKPDPMASSYASAKHGLKGLVESLQGEELPLDLRFFRPGYMNTDMLPTNAKPRLTSEKIAEPGDVARSFVSWALDPSGEPIKDYQSL